MTITFALSGWLVFFICCGATVLVLYSYQKRLAKSPVWLKCVLPTVRVTTTLLLIFVVLDMAISYQTIGRRALMIVRSAAPTMELADAGGGKTRNAVADDVMNRLKADIRVRERFEFGVASASELSQWEAPVAAVLTTSDLSDGSRKEVETLGVPPGSGLFIATVTPDKGVPDVSVNGVDSDGRANLDVPYTVQVTLFGLNMAGRTTQVKLMDEVLVIASTTVVWRSDTETVNASMLVSPKTAGLRRFVASAELADGEINSNNNEIAFSVDVSEHKKRVLYLEKEPTWEARFVRRALAESRSIVVDYFVQTSRSAGLAQPQISEARDVHSVLGDFRALAGYEAIVLGPVDSASISAAEARNLVEFVEKRGGGLVFLGGNDYSGSVLGASSPLAVLSPAIVKLSVGASGPAAPTELSETGVSPPAGPASRSFISPTEEGRATLVFGPAPTGRVGLLGPLSESYLRAMSLRPGASSLAVDGSIEGGRPPVLVASQPYGAGKTLLFAPADSWRIGLSESPENRGQFATLWQNLILLCASGAEPPCYVQLRNADADNGGNIQAVLTARDEAFNPMKMVSIRASIAFTSADTTHRLQEIPVSVDRDPKSPGAYLLRAKVGMEGAGLLSVGLRLDDGRDLPLGLEFARKADRWMWRGSDGNAERLEQVAKATGGLLCDSSNPDPLVSRLLGIASDPQPKQNRIRIRQSALMAFLLPLLISGEYFLRRRYSVD